MKRDTAVHKKIIGLKYSSLHVNMIHVYSCKPNTEQRVIYSVTNALSFCHQTETVFLVVKCYHMAQQICRSNKIHLNSGSQSNIMSKRN